MKSDELILGKACLLEVLLTSCKTNQIETIDDLFSQHKLQINQYENILLKPVIGTMKRK